MRTFKKVLSVALVLAMAVSCFALTSLAKSTPGTITVDGKLDDNGWAADGWTTVDTTTGTAQEGKTQEGNLKDTFKYDFQFATDGTTLYFAFKTDFAPNYASETAQTGATNMRLWLRSGDSGKFDRLIDFFYSYDEESETYVPLVQRVTDNFNAEGSKLTAEDVTFTFVATENSYVGEASIALADLGITGESFNYALTFSAPNAGTEEKAVEGGEEGETETVDAYGCLIYPKYEKPEDAPLTNAPYNDGAVFQNVALDDIAIAATVEADFGWDIVIPEGKAGDEIDVTITLKGLADDKAVSLFSMFVTHSDNLVPVVTEPSVKGAPFMKEFGTKIPAAGSNGEEWESLGGAYSADDNAYYLCFGTADDNAAANGEIVLTIPFKIADDAKDGDELKVSINYDEALAEKFDITVENMDEDLKALDAGTADATIKVGVTDTSTDESVDVSSSASSTPADSSSTPSTSDFGLAAIIVLAVAAVIGAAVIIRKRA